MIICESYMFEFSVSKNMEKTLTMLKEEFQDIFQDLCLALVVRELKTNVEQGRVVTTLYIIKH